jgi:hypothetical protein
VADSVRAQFAIRSVARVSDPVGPMWRPEEDEGRDPFDAFPDATKTELAVWQSMYAYMQGKRGGAPSARPISREDVSRWERDIWTNGREMTRVGSAYLLGRAASASVAVMAGGGRDAAAAAAASLHCLQRLLLDPAERIRRAAAYGLTVSGEPGLRWLLELLKSSRVQQGPLDSGSIASAQPNVDVRQGIVVQAVHAVGMCGAELPLTGSATELLGEAVAVLTAVMSQADVEIKQRTLAATAEELAAQEPFLYDMCDMHDS